MNIKKPEYNDNRVNCFARDRVKTKVMGAIDGNDKGWKAAEISPTRSTSPNRYTKDK
jgi:hypothetical protein